MIIKSPVSNPWGISRFKNPPILVFGMLNDGGAGCGGSIVSVCGTGVCGGGGVCLLCIGDSGIRLRENDPSLCGIYRLYIVSPA